MNDPKQADRQRAGRMVTRALAKTIANRLTESQVASLILTAQEVEGAKRSHEQAKDNIACVMLRSA